MLFKRLIERRMKKEIIRMGLEFTEALGNYILQANDLNYGHKSINGIVYKDKDTLVRYIKDLLKEVEENELQMFILGLENHLFLIQDTSSDMNDYDFKISVYDNTLKKYKFIRV